MDGGAAPTTMAGSASSQRGRRRQGIVGGKGSGDKAQKSK